MFFGRRVGRIIQCVWLFCRCIINSFLCCKEYVRNKLKVVSLVQPDFEIKCSWGMLLLLYWILFILWPVSLRGQASPSASHISTFRVGIPLETRSLTQLTCTDGAHICIVATELREAIKQTKFFHIRFKFVFRATHSSSYDTNGTRNTTHAPTPPLITKFITVYDCVAHIALDALVVTRK